MASFAKEIENNIRKGYFHVPSNNFETHTHDRNGFKTSQQLVLPPLNQFGGWIRSKPRSGFNQATLFSAQGQLDFNLSSAGFVQKLFLELELNVIKNPVTFLPHYCIQRIEYLSNEGNILYTAYGDNVYLDEKLHQSIDVHNRVRLVENLDANYNPIPVPVGFKRIMIPLPSIVDGSEIKLNIIKGELLVRIYFSANGVAAGLVTDVTVTSCDILQKSQQLSQQGEVAETKMKLNRDLKFRMLAPVRYASETKQLTPNGQFDIRLTSANNLCAFMYFVIRAAPVSGLNANVFVNALDFFELLDDTNVIQGIKTNPQLNKWQGLSFDGDILNYKNVYSICFTIDVNASLNGQQTGFYAMTSNEILRLYTNSTLAIGSYIIDIYGLEHHILDINRGALSSMK